MTDPLARSGFCPSCGAPIAFPFAAARAQVCRHCHYVIVRTDRGFATGGRMADVLPLASRFGVGGMGAIDGTRFRVAGRVQYERTAGGAPWQEFYLELLTGAWIWIAEAQGRTYTTALVPGIQAPPFDMMGVGWTLNAAGRVYTFADRGERRLLSAEGELPFPVRPDQRERYIDVSGPGGIFGTIDYGDGSAPPVIFLGHLLDPARVVFDPGSAGSAAPEVATTALKCPGCGGDLPLLAPGTAERIVCRYCGLQSDLERGALRALKKVPIPSDPPVLPIGSRGTLDGRPVVCTGYLARSTVVEGEFFGWREYLLHAGDAGYLWLVEDEGKWQVVKPVEVGNVTTETNSPLANGSATLDGQSFAHSQTVTAKVDVVVGEFYWKVEAGETVDATEYLGGGGRKLNLEATADEVVWSLGTPISLDALAAAFPDVPFFGLGKKRRRAWRRTWMFLLLAWIVITVASCVASPGDALFAATLPVPPVVVNPEDPSAPDPTYFSPPFAVPEGKHRVELELRAPALDNSWVSAACALVNETTGEVFETNFEIEYYSGTEGGESWSEGSRNGSTIFGNVPGGSYVARVDATLDPSRAPPTLVLEVIRAPFRPIPMGVSFVVLAGVLWLGRKAGEP